MSTSPAISTPVKQISPSPIEACMSPTREHAARLADGEVDARALAVPVVVEVAAVRAREAVRQLLAVGRDADDADHRLRGEAHAVVHLDLAVAHLEEPRQRRLHLLDQLAEAGDERRDAPLDRAHVEDLDDRASRPARRPAPRPARSRC